MFLQPTPILRALLTFTSERNVNKSLAGSVSHGQCGVMRTIAGGVRPHLCVA